MQALFFALFAALIAVADQVTKYFTVANIPLHADVEVLPGVVGLTYWQNTGAAWSSFQGMQWLFAVIFLLFTLAVIWEYKKKSLGFTTFDHAVNKRRFPHIGDSHHHHANSTIGHSFLFPSGNFITECFAQKRQK